MLLKHPHAYAIGIASVIFACCSCTRVSAHVSSPSTNSIAQYHRAVTLLDSGRNYEAAAALLRTPIRSEPANPAYHTALACAYADRAASLSYALCFRQMLAQVQTSYPQDLADWQKAQADKTGSDYASPRPTLPKSRIFPTKDDGKPLTLTDSEAIAEITRLANLAEQEWKTGVRLSPPGSKRAAAEESFGWGLRLFERCQSAWLGRPNIMGLMFANDTSAQVWKQLSNATRDDPKNPAYWQSLGDEVWATNGDGFFAAPIGDLPSAWLPTIDPSDHQPSPAGNFESMVGAYRRSLALHPDNAAVWVRLFDLSRHAKPDVALAMLHSASRYDPQSANLHYEAAELLFKKTPYGNIEDYDYDHDAVIPQVAKEATPTDSRSGILALREIERGNDCKAYAAPEYSISIPTDLQTAWGYWYMLVDFGRVHFTDLARMRDLARQAMGFACVSEFDRQPDQAIRVTNAVTAMGAKLAGNWPTRESHVGNGELLHPLAGAAVIAIGDECLLKAAEMSGDGAVINQADDRWTAFRRRETAYAKLVEANLALVNPSESLLDSY